MIVIDSQLLRIGAPLRVEHADDGERIFKLGSQTTNERRRPTNWHSRRIGSRSHSWIGDLSSSSAPQKLLLVTCVSTFRGAVYLYWMGGKGSPALNGTPLIAPQQLRKRFHIISWVRVWAGLSWAGSPVRFVWGRRRRSSAAVNAIKWCTKVSKCPSESNWDHTVARLCNLYELSTNILSVLIKMNFFPRSLLLGYRSFN